MCRSDKACGLLPITILKTSLAYGIDMDIATVIGFVASMGLIIWSMDNAASLGAFNDPVSYAIVFGGSIMVLLMRSKLADFINMWSKTIMKTIFAGVDKPADLIEQIIEMANIARKDGLHVATFARAPLRALALRCFAALSPAHALLLLLEQDRLEGGPLLQPVRERRLQPRLGGEEHLLAVVERGAGANLLLDALHAP